MTNQITVKSLKEEAKVLGIKGYSKMTKAALLLAIEQAKGSAKPQPASDSEQASDVFDAMSGDLNDDDTSEETSASTQETPAVDLDDDDLFTEDTIVQVNHPLVKYLKSDNTRVEFLVRGKRVIIGWSKKDYNMHIFKESTGTSCVTSYITQIQFFKKLINGRDGDIALVVAALKRIKAKPALIKVLERKSHVAEQNVSAQTSEENTRPHRGAVDPIILSKFVSAYSTMMNISEKEVRSNYGKEIRQFFNGLDSSMTVDQAIDTYMYTVLSNDYM
ncbi:Rho termination factor N-terminal domain-containing protein (plasmid) [Paenibacillus sp. EC2-1]|uniref:Rho termination factor N-terminal domain-containing protein n=1 Tax=Paenibacillus sp. EC2-1 TaxID=3388665 RepID=UPI003BEF3E49